MYIFLFFCVQVWNEVIEGEEGATNFMTGSGGFLQAILNGYAGIRMYIDRMEIKNPRMPHETDKLSISGNNLFIFYIFIN